MSGSTPTTAADAAQGTDPADPGFPLAAGDRALLRQVLQQWSASLPALVAAPDWQAHLAWRWVRRIGQGGLQPIPVATTLRFADLLGIPVQVARFERNLRQFVAGLPANHVLLTGARGGGKSSLVKAALSGFAPQGLRVIEVDRQGLADLPDILALVRGRPERFLLFCDDLSFDHGDHGYTALKSVLDGSVAAGADNLLVVATSNRRHLMPDLHTDNQAVQHLGDEIHPGEAIEEKVSLSDRFGLWLAFHAMDQATYLAIARHWAAALGHPAGADPDRFQHEALEWALLRSSRSGRSAWQFARDWAGRQGLGT